MSKQPCTIDSCPDHKPTMDTRAVRFVIGTDRETWEREVSDAQAHGWVKFGSPFIGWSAGQKVNTYLYAQRMAR